MIDTLGYSDVELTVSIKDFSKIEKCINVFRYENKLTYPIHISDQNFENSIDLLVIFDGDKSHYAYIKDFDRFMFSKTKNNNKKYFCRYCLQCFSSENVLADQKVCSKIKSEQSVKSEGGFLEFKNFFKQLPVSFKLILSIF